VYIVSQRNPIADEGSGETQNQKFSTTTIHLLTGQSDPRFFQMHFFASAVLGRSVKGCGSKGTTLPDRALTVLLSSLSHRGSVLSDSHYSVGTVTARAGVGRRCSAVIKLYWIPIGLFSDILNSIPLCLGLRGSLESPPPLVP
jgi:hypothetical protein